MNAYIKGEQERTRENLIVFTNNLKNDCQNLTKLGEDMTTFKGNKLTKRKDGRWVYTKTENKKRIYIYATTQQKLIEKIKKHKTTTQNTIKNDNTIDFINNWYTLTKEPNLSEKTKEIYKNTLNNYIKPLFNKKTLSQITLFELQNFINNIKFERTREQTYQHLKSIYKYALSCGKIKIDTTIALTLPKRKNTLRREALTIEEQKRLLDNIKGHKLETFILFSLVIGTRRNETLAFNICDINEEKQTLHIKGTKTQSADRTIKISKEMIEYIKQNNKTKPYFNFTEDYITKNIKMIFKNLNMEHCVHSLRHTCATNLYYLGIKDKERQNILGHKSIITTNNIYTSLELDVTKKDVVKLYNNLYYEFDNTFDNTFS